MDITTSLSRSDLRTMTQDDEPALPPKYSNAPVPIPVAFVPTPTQSFREHRKMLKALVQPGVPWSATTVAAGPSPIPIPLPLPLPIGARVLMWKQDPQVGEIGIRKAFLPSPISAGLRDSRIQIEGLPQVVPNDFGDLIVTPGTPAFDAVHTFAVVARRSPSINAREVERCCLGNGIPPAIPIRFAFSRMPG